MVRMIVLRWWRLSRFFRLVMSLLLVSWVLTVGFLMELCSLYRVLRLTGLRWLLIMPVPALVDSCYLLAGRWN